MEGQPVRRASQGRVRGGISGVTVYKNKERLWGDIGRGEEDRITEND